MSITQNVNKPKQEKPMKTNRKYKKQHLKLHLRVCFLVDHNIVLSKVIIEFLLWYLKIYSKVLTIISYFIAIYFITKYKLHFYHIKFSLRDLPLLDILGKGLIRISLFWCLEKMTPLNSESRFGMIYIFNV